MLASRVQNTKDNCFPNEMFYDFQNGKFSLSLPIFLMLQKEDLKKIHYFEKNL